MRRALVLLLVVLLGCGGVRFQVNSLPSNAVVASGIVTFVQFTAIIDGNGTLVNVTVVTLAQGGLPQTLTFCGSQAGLFPADRNIRVTFVPATICANVLAVVSL